MYKHTSVLNVHMNNVGTYEKLFFFCFSNFKFLKYPAQKF